MRVLNLVTNADTPFYRQQLRALGRRGIEETTVGVPGERRVTDGSGDADGGSRRSVADYVRFYARVLRHAVDDCDVVHANYGLTAPAALAQPRRPVVVSLWGSDLFGGFGPVCRWCARRADAVVVMSEAMADAVGVDCHVIPHGVDLRLFRPIPRRSAREAVGWRHDARHVLFPYARGRPVKNYPRAERVVAEAGERLDEPVALHAVSGVPHERMPLYLNAADALVLTSRHEGSPNSVKEAMACNLPVVSTDVGDVRERLCDVAPSHVCRTDEQLVAGLVDVLGGWRPSDGRDAVEHLGVERMGARLAAVYRSVQ